MYQEPDGEKAGRMIEAQKRAGVALGVLPAGPRQWGWHGRSLSLRVQDSGHGACWLRIMEETPERAGTTPEWFGTELTVRRFREVRRPGVIAIHDMRERGWAYRAELTTFVDEPLLSPTPQLTADLHLPPEWWAWTRKNLYYVGQEHTDRIAVRQSWIERVVPEMTGYPAPHVTHWACAHGDFHPANVTTGATVLDWEGWGMAPYGWDAALFYAFAQTAPATAAVIRREFGALLDHAAGQAAILIACALLLQSVERGDFTELGPYLNRLAQHAAAEIAAAERNRQRPMLTSS
ncbi:hypothetical protein [Streptomyces sp. NPDC088707]|uniref:hypothetical protein n=1 Tax=Streptomyces sp. NPDC088707 TaxID=3365871 RepID=UPI003802DD57